MNYCIKFDHLEVFSADKQSAIAAAVQLAKAFQTVQVWQGSKMIWDFSNK
jgi:hypothetical protein